MNGIINIIAPEKTSNHSVYLISQHDDSNTNHSFTVGFAWACKNPYSFGGYKYIAATHARTLRLTQIENV